MISGKPFMPLFKKYQKNLYFMQNYLRKLLCLAEALTAWRKLGLGGSCLYSRGSWRPGVPSIPLPPK